MEEIVNRVANSGIITLDFEEKLDVPEEVEVLDMKAFLFQGLLLKEKEFRNQLKETDWSVYKDKVVSIQNSNEAIIPKWAFMLLANYLKDEAKYVYVGSEKETFQSYILQQVDAINFEEFQDKRVILKGCGEKEIPEMIYLRFTENLLPFAKTIMYGEPCSTVPVFKKK